MNFIKKIIKFFTPQKWETIQTIEVDGFNAMSFCIHRLNNKKEGYRWRQIKEATDNFSSCSIWVLEKIVEN